jgi:hypothetical protein
MSRHPLGKAGLFIAGAVVAILVQQALAAEKKTPAVAPLSVTSITCSVSGSSLPGANNSRAMTISDTDLQHVLDWVKTAYLQIIADQFNNGVTTGFNPTNGQIEWGWFQATVVNFSTQAEQQYRITPAVVPPPISIQ